MALKAGAAAEAALAGPLRELHGDKLRTWNQHGMLPLISAHLFSLDQMRIIFGRQIEQGWQPAANSGDAKTEKVETSA